MDPQNRFQNGLCCFCGESVLYLCVCVNRDGWLVAWRLCGCMLIRFSTVLHRESNTGKAEPRTTIPCMLTTARSSADLTKPNQTPTRYILANDTIILQIATPSCHSKSTHARRTYTGMRPRALGQQAGGGDHPVLAHTERHNPSKVWTQRKARKPHTSCQLTGALASLPAM